MFFSSREILSRQNSSSNWPLVFGQVGGSMQLERYAASIGDRLKGSFSLKMEGDQTICLDAECGTGTSQIITGTINGVFNGFLKDFSNIAADHAIAR